LTSTLEAHGEPGYRADQVWSWLARGAAGYDDMTDLPAGLRRVLADHVPISTLTVEDEARSSDGTVKVLSSTADGRPVEAVLMRYRDGRRSICVSSQSGCPLTCSFCATGTMRFGRNLSADEIVDQALYLRRIEAVDHCVFMGMGEPMMNLDNVLEACRLLPDIGITNRRTAISTVGWVPGIRRLTAERTAIRLALSLHAPDDELRSELMPVNDRYPIAEVLAACEEHALTMRRKVFVEYVMLEGRNDSPEQAVALADLLDPKHYKINLIPYNPTGSYTGSDPETIDAFAGVLARRGLSATVRLTRGQDIAAACGQLAAKLSQAPPRTAAGRV
jgi:23S rRNA (adenine2503-C2)-methyltransferase